MHAQFGIKRGATCNAHQSIVIDHEAKIAG
jgi:hypothetical protein